MHAADVIASLPTATLADPVISAARMVSQQGAPGLIVTGDRGEIVACMSTVDLLRFALPPYLRDEPHLAQLFGEAHADRIAEDLIGRTVNDVVTELADRRPAIDSGATIVELVQTMVRQSSPIIMVNGDSNEPLGAATANQVLDAMVAAVDGSSR